MADILAASVDIDNPNDSTYDCNICFNTARNVVISLCGHLFCWPCLHPLLEAKPNGLSCPVCESDITQDRVIPLFGRDSSHIDPRDSVPPRPAAQRIEPPSGDYIFGETYQQMFLAIGSLLFRFFTANLYLEMDDMHISIATRPARYEHERYYSKLFFYFSLLVLVYLIIT